MPVTPNWVDSLLKITKSTKKELTILAWAFCIFVIMWLVRFIIIGQDADCDKNYNKLEKLYNIKDMETKYLSDDKRKLLVLNDSLWQIIFKLKRQNSEYEQKLLSK